MGEPISPAARAAVERLLEPMVVGSDEAEALVGAARTACTAYLRCRGQLSKLGGAESDLRVLDTAMRDLAGRAGVRVA
jgi:hypothetical protein